MTRTERRISIGLAIAWGFLAGLIIGQCSAGECRDRGTGRLTRVFGLHSPTSVLYLRFDCADGSWREEAIWGPLILDDYARATNAITGKDE